MKDEINTHATTHTSAEILGEIIGLAPEVIKTELNLNSTTQEINIDELREKITGLLDKTFHE